ncbi:MAG TPA: hypothetical protein DIU15_11040 [Deltaproteobacteria bacterium]|mgnify:CR=1 FL=1|nr:hypothetical protein [Deltaproteobacteria bacterium]HCP46572.1 hypothetical protein [Deltaproteobacteria bacterium]
MKLRLPSAQSLRENIGLKILSLLLALSAWMLAQGEQTYHATVVVPVEYRFPEGLILSGDTPPPDQVVIQTSGSRAAMKALQEEVRAIEIVYEVDLRYAEPGRTIHTFRQLPEGLPDQVTIHTVSPAEVELVLDVLVSRTLPVEIRTRGELPEGYAETARSTQPTNVEIRGGQSKLKDIDVLYTEAVRLNQRTADFETELALDMSNLDIHPSSPSTVIGAMRIQEVPGRRGLDTLPIQLPEEAAGLELSPADCSVSLEGPLPVLLDLGPAAVTAHLRASAQALGAMGPTTTVPWLLDGDPAEGPHLQIIIEHPRADDVKVASVDPSTYTLTGSPSNPPARRSTPAASRSTPAEPEASGVGPADPADPPAESSGSPSPSTEPVATGG